MKKFLLGSLLFFIAFLTILAIPKKTYAQTCSCTVNFGVCAMVTQNNCGAGKRPSCQNGNVPGICGSPSCICIDQTETCTISPDSCTNPNESCQCDTSGCSCKADIPTTPVPATPMSKTPTPNYLDDKVINNIFCDSSGTATNDPTSKKILTAIGCIPVGSSEEFIVWILNWAIGIGGGIALLLIILASFQIMTSSGIPEKAQAGKELLTSAIAGLILLIFSIFILKVIGVDILKIPGLS